jgi:REP element-mobilizing transposase RayT
MPQSFVSLNCHAVFSTKNREPLLTESVQSRLYEYVGGTARHIGSTVLAIGGMPDHVHLLLSLGKQSPIADLIRDIKSNSSRWIHETFENLRGFAWQTGYGAFSVSCSNLDQVRGYIGQQVAHHRTRTFQEEFLTLLQRHNIEYDEQFLWD